MFRHIVLFRWKESATTEQRDAAISAVHRLGSQIAHLGRLTVGADAGVGDDNADVAVVVDFDSADDYRAYMADENHQQVIAEYLRPILAERTAVQHEL